MRRNILILIAFGLLLFWAWVASLGSDRPTTSQARASTPTARASTPAVTPSPTQGTTATAAATPVVSATPSGPETIHETYIVQPGDTLNRIAARFSQEPGHNVTVAAIVAANGISNPALIGVGQQFTIPVVVTDGSAAPTAAPSLGVTSLGVTCDQVYEPLVASSVRWVPEGKLNRHTADWHSTMTPNGSITVELFGPCTGLEAVEVWFYRTAPPDQILITRDIVVAAAMSDHAAEVGAWFDDALDRIGETGDLIQRERLAQIYLTMAYTEKSQRFVYIMDVMPQQ